MSKPIQQPSSHQDRADLQALLETSRLLIESHDESFVLNNLLLVCMGKLMVQRAAVFLYEPSQKRYALAAAKGRVSLDETGSGLRDLFRQKNSFACDEHPFLSELCDHEFTVVIALQNSKRHLGFLALGNKTHKKPVTPAEIEILEGIVFISGIALSNSRLVNELRNTNRKLDAKVQELFTLFDLGKTFSASHNRREIRRIFRFTLLGQFFVRTFFLLGMREGTACLMASNGLAEVPEEHQQLTLLGLEKNIIHVDQELASAFPFLKSSGITLLLKLHNEGEEPAIFGLGARANDKLFEPVDYPFLIALGNLALMTLQKTWLLEAQIEKERMQEELNIARSIQQKLLPESIPEIAGLHIAARNVPSYEVGGDYFDLIRDPQGTLTMAIADVTGKGVPASLIMANLQSVLHLLHPPHSSLVEATGRINSLMYQNTPADKFISFFWAWFQPKNRELFYVNAGHNPPLLFRQGSAPVELSMGGVLLGAMPTLSPYEQGQIQLQTGDLLLLYTDGVTEAMNEVEEEYGEERMLACVNRHLDLPPDALLDRLLHDVQSFCKNRFSDDLTVIICRVTDN